MSKKKYRRGRRFRTIGELANYVADGGWIYLRKNAARPTHHGWARSMTLHTLEGYIRRGAYRAIRVEE